MPRKDGRFKIFKGLSKQELDKLRKKRGKGKGKK